MNNENKGINHRINQINIFGRMSQNIKKSKKGGFTMKIFKLFLAAMSLMLLGCTNGNGGGNGNKGDDIPKFACFGEIEIPKGSLNSRSGGVRVNLNNAENFVALLGNAMYADNPSSVFGRKENNLIITPMGEWDIEEFFDYSENGRLFLGGGTVELEKDNSDDMCFSAVIRFNGEFVGTLVMDNLTINFEYFEDRFIVRRIGGIVKVDGIDITDIFFEECRVTYYTGETYDCSTNKLIAKTNVMRGIVR